MVKSLKKGDKNMLDQYAKINKIRRKVFEEVARLAYEGGDRKSVV